jgi:hypothetical protein
LQRTEIGRSVRVQRADLAVDDAIRQVRPVCCDLGKLVGPIKALRVRKTARPFSTRI